MAVNPLLWWPVIAIVVVVNHYSLSYKGGMRMKIKRVRFSSAVFLASFIAYLVWLLLYGSGDTVLDYSPMLGFIFAAVYPWLVAIREFEKEK